MKTYIFAALLSALTYAALCYLLYRSNKRLERKERTRSRLTALAFQQYKGDENRKNFGYIRK